KDPGRRPRVGAILHELCEALRTAAQLLAPFLPETGERLAGLLGLPAARLGELDLPWGAAFAAGHRTFPPEPLFPRIEVPAEWASLSRLSTRTATSPSPSSTPTATPCWPAP